RNQAAAAQPARLTRPGVLTRSDLELDPFTGHFGRPVYTRAKCFRISPGENRAGALRARAQDCDWTVSASPYPLRAARPSRAAGETLLMDVQVHPEEDQGPEQNRQQRGEELPPRSQV